MSLPDCHCLHRDRALQSLSPELKRQYRSLTREAGTPVVELSAASQVGISRKPESWEELDYSKRLLCQAKHLPPN